MRTYYWYLTAYLRKHGLILFASLLVAVVVFSFLIPAIVDRFGQKNRVYVGVVGDYTLYTLPRTIQDKLSLGLTTVAADGTAVSELAERWNVEDEGKTYRFVIKKNLFWQDGQPFTPADINYNFRDVEVVSTQNDVVFKLPDAYVPFPIVVSQPLLKVQEKTQWFFFKKPTLVGLGDYQLTSYQTNGEQITQVILENDQEILIYRFYLTEADAVLGFKRGEVDVLPDLSSTYDLGTWKTVTTTTTLHTERYLAVFFNNPLFAKNVRQALSYAIEKPPEDIRAVGPINPSSWAYFQGGKTYDYDLNRALERILDEVPQQPLAIELTTTVNFQSDAEKIKNQWEVFGQQAVAACQSSKDIEDKNTCQNLGITVTIRINNFPDTSNFQVLLIGQETPADPDQYYLWHSSQSTNFTHYKNTRIDSLLEKGRQTVEQPERLAIYQEFQQFFLEDAPAIFLRYLESYEVKRR